ncbi:MAG: LURP-one-related family protein [Ruminococcus sp.]|nr:LURP-one-related family protein [Ruminococcus sp.]
MKLFIRQKVFSWRSRFSVRDESGNDVYSAWGEIMTIGRKLHVEDSFGEEKLLIHQKVLTILPRYRIYCGGRFAAEIQRKLSLFRAKYDISGPQCPGWSVTGSVTNHNYSIMSDSGTVATVSKAWLSWGDSYEIDYTDPDDELLVLAAVLAIDCMNADADDAAMTTVTYNA